MPRPCGLRRLSSTRGATAARRPVDRMHNVTALRHTKIVATLGPASSPMAILRDLVTAGVDVFRLNFSHGSHESHAAAFQSIRQASKDAGRAVAVMQDLSGPKI